MRSAVIHAPRFQLVYLKGVDRASHRFWYEYEPGNPQFASRPKDPEVIARYRNTILDTYRYADQWVGRLIDGLGEDDVVMLLSDHGFEAADAGPNSGNHGISDASIDGIYVMAGGPIVGGACPEEISIYDVAPTALYLLGLAIPAHMQGEVPANLFAPGYLTSTPIERSAAIPPRDPADASPSPEDAAETNRIERLRALGYFDDPE